MNHHTLSGPVEVASEAVRLRATRIEAELAPADAAYLAGVRAAALRLARRELDPGDARGALEALVAVSSVDADVPTLSRRPAVRYLKVGVKQLGGWYLRYVAQQVTALGTATVAWGSAMAIRADALEEATALLSRRVASLEDRLAALESPAPESPAPGPAAAPSTGAVPAPGPVAAAGAVAPSPAGPGAEGGRS